MSNLCTAFWANLILAAINRNAGEHGLASFNSICALICILICIAWLLFDFHAFVKARRRDGHD